MKPDAQRVAVILVLVAVGFILWPGKWGLACWTLATVYAILTSSRRFL